MSITIKTSGVHHIALRVSDLPRARRFYTETLGFPVLAEMPGLVLFLGTIARYRRIGGRVTAIRTNCGRRRRRPTPSA